LYQGCTVTKTSHLQIRYFLALLWAHPILHISTIRVKYIIIIIIIAIYSISRNVWGGKMRDFVTYKSTDMGRSKTGQDDAG
jgi:hypothetical protein